MNYNLNTAEGMANAIRWTEELLATLNEGGVWAIPRSSSGYMLVDRKDKLIRLTFGQGDGATERVLAEAGWRVVK